MQPRNPDRTGELQTILGTLDRLSHLLAKRYRLLYAQVEPQPILLISPPWGNQLAVADRILHGDEVGRTESYRHMRASIDGVFVDWEAPL
jgi:hypothetical protein